MSSILSICILIILGISSCNPLINFSIKETNPKLAGVWELVETLNIKTNLIESSTDFPEEITIYSEVHIVNIEDLNYKGFEIGKSNYIFHGLNPETYQMEIMENSCYCSFYTNKENNKYWIKTCEDSTEYYEIQLKKDYLYMENITSNKLHKYQKRKQ